MIQLKVQKEIIDNSITNWQRFALKQLNLMLIFLIFVFPGCGNSGTDGGNRESTIVDHFGQISVDGSKIVDQHGDAIILRGMSLFWSQWGSQYYNKETITWLRDDWKCTVIRAAVGVENGGYLQDSTSQLETLYRAIDACIDLGIYVIVDWHDHHGEEHIAKASAFFDIISKKYGDYPNIIYELYNEPIDVSWNDVLKPYAQTMISIIRQNDPDNLIVMGSSTWSQDVDAVIGNQLSDANTAYSLHFYTSTHRQELRDKGSAAIQGGIPLFVTEWGLSEASGTGEIDLQESALWIQFIESNALSWCNWSVINKDESSAALKPATTTLSGWSENDLTESGRMIRQYLIDQNTAIYNLLK